MWILEEQGSALVETFNSKTFMSCIEGVGTGNMYKIRVTNVRNYKLGKENMNFEFTQTS